MDAHIIVVTLEKTSDSDMNNVNWVCEKLDDPYKRILETTDNTLKGLQDIEKETERNAVVAGELKKACTKLAFMEADLTADLAALEGTIDAVEDGNWEPGNHHCRRWPPDPTRTPGRVSSRG